MQAVPTQKLILEPGRTAKNYWRDLFHYRELFLILAWRDVIVRYKQTTAGAAWALIQPLMSIVIMTIIFGKIAGLPSEGKAPYAIMVCAAMILWESFKRWYLILVLKKHPKKIHDKNHKDREMPEYGCC